MPSANPLKVSKKDLIHDIQKLNTNHGKTSPSPLTRNYYRANSQYSESQWQKHFPRFEDFLAAAGIESPDNATPKKPKLEDLPVEEQSTALHFKSQAQTIAASYKSLLKERGRYKALVEDLKDAVLALEPYPRQPIAVRKGASNTPIAAVVKLSDWQIGEVIEPSETEGFGAFNFAIAEERAFKLVKKVLDWVHMHREAGYNLRTLHIFSEADLVSGNIHYELEVTNEFPVTVAAAKAGNLLAQVVAQFAPHFDSVVVWEMSADNHGRMTRKNQAKQGALNNYSYVAHVICNEILSKHENVKIEMGEGTKLLADVMGKKFLISHGHHIMSQAGIPFYGMQRDKAREATKRAQSDFMFDYISIGHWHVPSIIDQNILVNGSLTGTTEFDHMCGRHALPAQVSFMVHPKFGVFNWTAWKLDDGIPNAQA